MTMQPGGALLNERVLLTIHGEHISKAAAELPEAATATDAPHRVVIRLPSPDGRRVLLTFRRFRHKRGTRTHWFWTAEQAEVLPLKR